MDLSKKVSNFAIIAGIIFFCRFVFESTVYVNMTYSVNLKNTNQVSKKESRKENETWMNDRGRTNLG